VRAHIIFAGLAGAFVLWFLGAIFDLNGAQWDWWSGACRTAIVPLLLAARSGWHVERAENVRGYNSFTPAESSAAVCWSPRA
jgi:hypothetical protein